MNQPKLLGLLILILSASLAPIGAWPLKLSDAQGRAVVIKAQPRRIVSLLPSVTEILCSLGLKSAIIGRTAYCDYPPSVKTIPVVGDLFLDYERILALDPDLIVADVEMQKADLTRLTRLGFQVLAVNSQNLADLKKTLILLGKATGKEKTAQKLLTALNRELEEIRRETEKHPISSRPLTLAEIQFRPLITAGKGTYIDELITLSGGNNLGAEINGYGEMGLEDIIKADPQVILLTTVRSSDLSASPIWKETRAVREGRILAIDPDLLSRPTLRVTETLKLLQSYFGGEK